MEPHLLPKVPLDDHESDAALCGGLRIKTRVILREGLDTVGIAAKIVPLSRTMKEQIGHISSWKFERAVSASPHPHGR